MVTDFFLVYFEGFLVNVGDEKRKELRKSERIFEENYAKGVHIGRPEVYGNQKGTHLRKKKKKIKGKN